MSWDNKVPFSESGNLVTYVTPYRHDEVEWRDNYEFHTMLRVTNITRGRSAARFILHDVYTEHRYEMFLTDALDMMQHGRIIDGTISGTWTFCKRGQNFGLKYASTG